MNPINPNNLPTARLQIERERALFRYHLALERGDDSVLSQVLHQAESDAVLESMICQWHQMETLQETTAVRQSDALQVRQMLETHLPSSRPTLVRPEVEADISEPPPFTVADVAARMQADFAQTSWADTPDAEASSLTQQLSRVKLPLPEKLNARSVRQFFENLGVAAPRGFQSSFRETALFLLMGRRQGMSQLAATRRQRRQKSADEKPQREPQREEERP